MTMVDDRKGLSMTDLTPREILEAIRRGLEETARRFAGRGADAIDEQRKPPHPIDRIDDRTPQSRREE
jgi:hypothetical protein